MSEEDTAESGQKESANEHTEGQSKPDRIDAVEKKASPDTARQEPKPREPATRYERWLIASAASQIVLGIIGVCILYKQASITAEQTTLFDKQNKIMEAQNILIKQGTDRAQAQSGESLKASAEQGKAVLSASIEQSRLDQRAWIGAFRVIAQELKPEVQMFFGARISNSGKTPARKVTTETAWRALPVAQPFSPVYPGTIRQPSNSVLMPGMEVSLIAAPVKFGKDQVAAIASSQLFFYVYGRIGYEDIFRRPHTTTWCFQMDRDLARMQACNMYNEAN